MKQDSESPAAHIAHGALRLAERLDPQESDGHMYVTQDDKLHDIARLVATNTRMITPIYKAFYNGGLPMKKRGKTYPFMGREVSAGELVTMVYRIVLAALLGTIAIKNGATVDVGIDHIKVAPGTTAQAQAQAHKP